MGRRSAVRAIGMAGLLLVLGYAGLCTLLYMKQRSLIYFPQGTRAEAAATDVALPRPDAVLRGWVVNPGQARALVYFGGNGERIEGNRDALRAALPATTAYLFAYRGYGASDGQPEESLILADALAVFDHATANHGSTHVDVAGRSLGTGVASYVASQRDVPRLVLITPFDSLAKVAQSHYPAFPVHWLLRDRYDSLRYLPRHRGQLLVLRAGRDEVIPAHHTRALLQAFGHPARVVDFPDAGHNSISDDPRYWTSLGGFLQAEDGPGMPPGGTR